MNNNDPSALIGMVCFFGVAVGLLALVITIWWKIWQKTGNSGALALLMLIPLVNIIMLLVLAFSDWPVQQEVRRLRRELEDRDYGRGGGMYGGEAPRALPPRQGEGDYGYTR